MCYVAASASCFLKMNLLGVTSPIPVRRQLLMSKFLFTYKTDHNSLKDCNADEGMGLSSATSNIQLLTLTLYTCSQKTANPLYDQSVPGQRRANPLYDTHQSMVNSEDGGKGYQPSYSGSLDHGDKANIIYTKPSKDKQVGRVFHCFKYYKFITQKPQNLFSNRPICRFTFQYIVPFAKL